MPSVSVTINGKNYRMACDEGQEPHLESLAAEFDGYVNDLRGSFGEIGDQRLTVMAGIMVTDELLELKRKVERLDAEVNSLRESGANGDRQRQAGDDALAASIEEIAKKIENIGGMLTE